MKINQRDVFLLPHPLGDGEPHPHIVLSISEANHCESTLIAVMLTSSPYTVDDHSFLLEDGMFEKPLKKEGTHVRMHLVRLSENHDIIPPKISRMKKWAFDKMMSIIGETIFNYTFKPPDQRP